MSDVGGHPPRVMLQVQPLAFTSTGLLMAHGAAICKRIWADQNDNGMDHIVMAVSQEILNEFGENPV